MFVLNYSRAHPWREGLLQGVRAGQSRRATPFFRSLRAHLIIESITALFSKVQEQS